MSLFVSCCFRKVSNFQHRTLPIEAKCFTLNQLKMISFSRTVLYRFVRSSDVIGFVFQLRSAHDHHMELVQLQGSEVC